MFGWFNKQAQRKAKQKPLTVHEIIAQRAARLPERRAAANPPRMEVDAVDTVIGIASDDRENFLTRDMHHTAVARHHNHDSGHSGHSHSSYDGGGSDSGGGDGGGSD